MANVFLSYSRADVECARSLAAVLERAGHEVWWDTNIKGGARFGTEIEAALDRADKIVVLWSAEAIRSAWVQDEAAVGRDTGRLVPVTIDGTPAPLGFRQYQIIDISGWHRRGSPPNVAKLLDAVGAGSADQPRTSERSPARRPRPKSARPALYVSVIASLVALAGAGWWFSGRASAHPPVVLITSDDSSPASLQSVRELTVRLANLQSARGDAFELRSGAGDADLILQVSAAEDAKGLRRDLSILSGDEKSILWSASLEQPTSKADELTQQMTLTSERVLTCALDALLDNEDRIAETTLKQYLVGCERAQDVYGLGQYDPALDALFEQVVAKAPHFAGAWAKLLQFEAEIVKNADPPKILVDKLRKHVAQVEKLGLDIGELYVAKASLLQANDFAGALALYDQGIRADPDNPYLYRMRSEKLQEVGRMRDSVADAYQALELDPLSPALMDNFISTLAYSGKIESAYEQLRKAEAMWPNAKNLKEARYRLDLRFGDPKEALTLFESSFAQGAFPEQESFIRARIDPTPANQQRAIDDEMQGYRQEPRYIAGIVQALNQFGRKDEAIDALLNYKRPDAIGYNSGVLFRPAMNEMWRDPRSMAAAAHVGLLAFWESSGRWPDFCADPKLPYDCKKEAAKLKAA